MEGEEHGSAERIFQEGQLQGIDQLLAEVNCGACIEAARVYGLALDYGTTGHSPELRARRASAPETSGYSPAPGCVCPYLPSQL